MTKEELIARLKKPEWNDLECKRSQHGVSEDAVAFRRIGFSENAGWGLNDVISQWTKLGHPRPVIHNSKASKDFELVLIGDNSPVSSGQLQNGNTEPEATRQVTQQVTQQVAKLLAACVGESSRAELMKAVGIRDRVSFSRNYLDPALADGLIEMTQPDSPKSPTQKYRLTGKGHVLLGKNNEQE